MDHDCRYQEVIIDNIKNIASIQENTKNTSDKVDSLEEKIDLLIADMQSIKMSKAEEGVFKKIMKTAAVFVICLVTNIFWNNVTGMFK